MPTPKALSPWRSYLLWLAATVTALLAGVCAFNVLIDPLGVFGSPRIKGINALQPYIYHHQELARWQAAQRLCPSAGIFGNSRAEIGFDPTHQAFAAKGLTAFNHAIPGSGANLAVRQLDWLQAAGCNPRTIIFGVEFFEFLGGEKASQRLEVSAPPKLDSRFFSESVLSVIGLRDAVETILTQRARHPATITARGFNPLGQAIGEVEASGHYLLFRQRADENLRIWSRKAPRIDASDGGRTAAQMAVETFLERATREGSEVNLVIYPYHAEIRLMLERLGLGSLFNDWKRRVVTLAGHYPNVRVWDFSGISPEILEEIPPRGDRHTLLKYYWESGHFNASLGGRALARILGGDETFGVELRDNKLENWLREDSNRVQALLTKPSPLLTEVDDVLAKAQRSH